MWRLSFGLSALCFVLCALSLWFLTLDAETKAQSFYWQPLSEDRLEAKLLADISATPTATPDEIITLASPIAERDPRSIFARTSLAGAFLQKGDVKALEAHFFPIFNMGNENTDDFIKILVQLSTTPQIFEAITNHIRDEKPVWGILYLTQLMNTDRDFSEFQELYTFYPDQLSGFFAKLLKRDGVAAAYDAFTQISPEVSAKDSIVIDAKFSNERLKWPFGWTLDDKIVERELSGGVSLIYFGRGTPVILEQLAKVEPGDYTIGITLSGNGSRTNGFYALQLSCWKGSEIANFIIDEVSTQTKTLAFNFEIADQTCDFAHVRLIGQAGDYPRPVRTTVKMIQIQSVDRKEAP